MKKAILVSFTATTRIVVDIPEGMTVEEYVGKNSDAVRRIASSRMKRHVNSYLCTDNMEAAEDTEVPAAGNEEQDHDPADVDMRIRQVLLRLSPEGDLDIDFTDLWENTEFRSETLAFNDDYAVTGLFINSTGDIYVTGESKSDLEELDFSLSDLNQDTKEEIFEMLREIEAYVESGEAVIEPVGDSYRVTRKD